ncbi:MAG TPA: L7Ae/L30e/S12e/Gadd45 family ribosomal protein [Bacillota bacterium]|nr:L7Ae/L30e/S12e/Gadd45 family ribosomal protein [Bacillota bacterium]HPT88519.1 L7Ae/L30e/S12e/Gadd45 family ribosomal protein [Bacillota bacterium]
MSKIDSLLGFASKAGQLLLGTASVEAGLKRGKVALVICATDLSPKTIKNFRYFCELYKVPFYCYGLRSELGRIVGAPERGIIGVVSKQFASSLRRLLDDYFMDRGDKS